MGSCCSCYDKDDEHDPPARDIDPPDSIAPDPMLEELETNEVRRTSSAGREITTWPRPEWARNLNHGGYHTVPEEHTVWEDRRAKIGVGIYQMGERESRARNERRTSFGHRDASVPGAYDPRKPPPRTWLHRRSYPHRAHYADPTYPPRAALVMHNQGWNRSDGLEEYLNAEMWRDARAESDARREQVRS